MAAGVLARPDALFSRVGETFASAAAAQQGRVFLWFPAALAAGIGLYFTLPSEPALLLAACLAVLGLLLLWLGRRLPLLVLAAALILGFALAKFRAEWVATPLLPAATAEVSVSGHVVEVDRAAASRLTLIVAPHSIEGLAPEWTPRRIRLSMPVKLGDPAAGDVVTFKARLAPNPAPVMPGGFDYGRKLWFDSVGATGRVTADFAVTGVEAGPHDWLESRLESLRSAMGARIHAAIGEPWASFAEALITGERSTVPPDINRSLQMSGLFHILSISGLHMWLVAGGVFWTVRAALALVPALALAWPIKKWAAAAALASGLFYMLLANSGVATERSFIMVAVVFFAVMVDRPALSIRSLAIAALIILLREPEAAVDASFQMSFLAVMGLVAFHEAWSRYTAARGQQEAPRHWAFRLAAWGFTAVALSLVTSLIAGAGSSLPAAYHFGRLSPYGVLANGLAIPVVGLVIMPAALVSVLLMPLGLDWLPLQVMAKGLEVLTLISDRVAALPGADAMLARPPALSVAVMAVGFVWLALLSGGLRWAGLPLLAVGAALALKAPPMPDLLVSRAGENVAFRNADGLLVPASPRRARFSVEKWLAAAGDEATFAEAARRAGWTCAGARCRASVKGRELMYVSGGEGQAIDCAGIDILVTDFPLRGACAAVRLRIDRFDLWRNGAQALYFDASGVRIETARESQGARPWVVRPRPRAAVFTPSSQQDDRPLD